MNARIRSRLDRLETRQERDHAPPNPLAVLLGLDRPVTLAELLDAASKVPAPPHDPREPTPNVVDVYAAIPKLDIEAAAVDYKPLAD